MWVCFDLCCVMFTNRFENMSSDTMTVAALGRPFTIGMLYDARQDKLIPGKTSCRQQRSNRITYSACLRSADKNFKWSRRTEKIKFMNQTKDLISMFPIRKGMLNPKNSRHSKFLFFFKCLDKTEKNGCFYSPKYLSCYIIHTLSAWGENKNLILTF